jgi:hypothetical protein
MRCELAVSRLPVGSSASRSRGPLASARALLLAAGKMVRRPVDLVAEADEIEQVIRAFAHLGAAHHAGAAHRDLHVFRRGEFLEQKMELEDEPDLLVAKDREGVVVEAGNLVPRNVDGAGVGPVEQAEQVKQRALAAARRAHDRVDVARMKLEGNAVEHMHPVLCLAEEPVQVVALEHDFGGFGGHGVF